MNARSARNEMRNRAIVVAVLATLFPLGCATSSTSTVPGVGPVPQPPVVAPQPGQ